MGRSPDRSDAVVAHLDKSHITVHTYPRATPIRESAHSGGHRRFHLRANHSAEALNFSSFLRPDMPIWTSGPGSPGRSTARNSQRHKINSIQNYIPAIPATFTR
jgi:hypothetical protein